jgi:hypothetical protein
MRTTNLLIVAFLTSILFTACSKDEEVVPSSTITTVEYDVKGYNRIDIQDTFEAEVYFSADEEHVRIEANENLHQYIHVEEDMQTLVIRLDDNISLEGKPATLKAYITTDHIYHYTGSGAVSIQVKDTVAAGSFEMHLSGASMLSGTFLGGDVNAVITGASRLNLIGTADKFTLDAEGACTMEGFDFHSDWLHANLEGASTASLTVNTKLDVWASGASTVYYKGEGIVNTQELTGASEIIKVN